MSALGQFLRSLQTLTGTEVFEMKARFHPKWSVAVRATATQCSRQLLVELFRDPECDAERALLAKGITGDLTLLDGKTGRPRTIVNIERAAGLMTTEENWSGLRFRKPPRTADNSPHSPETGSVDTEAA